MLYCLFDACPLSFPGRLRHLIPVRYSGKPGYCNPVEHGNPTSIVYDSLSRKVQMTDPAMGTWYYGYDKSGNLVQQTDAKGQTTRFHYDPLNRLASKEYVGYQDGAYDVSYSYDDDGTASPYAIGKLTKVIDHSGTTQLFYDKLGRKAGETRKIDGNTYSTGFVYDLLGRSYRSLTRITMW